MSHRHVTPSRLALRQFFQVSWQYSGVLHAIILYYTHVGLSYVKNMFLEKFQKLWRCDQHKISKRSHLKLESLGVCSNWYLIMVNALIGEQMTKLEQICQIFFLFHVTPSHLVWHLDIWTSGHLELQIFNFMC